MSPRAALNGHTKLALRIGAASGLATLLVIAWTYLLHPVATFAKARWDADVYAAIGRDSVRIGNEDGKLDQLNDSQLDMVDIIDSPPNSLTRHTLVKEFKRKHTRKEVP